MAKLVKKITVFTLLVVILSGCGLFRKKNGCHTCPTWKQAEAISEGAN